MAMRTLFELRKLINYLLKEGDISENTRIVVELARELNDSNKRWAIEAYQNRREEENKEFEKAIKELLKDSEGRYNIKADPNSKEDIKKMRLWYEQSEYKNYYGKVQKSLDRHGKNASSSLFDWNNIRNDSIAKIIKEKELVKKYRLWKEQNCKCIYTGAIISITDLFSENKIDIEHTLPRSKSFDNSLANMTVCYSNFNRYIKKNKIPFELKEYNQIIARIQHWKKRLDELEENIEYWKKESKATQDQEWKNYAIRQKHLWKFEYNYWKDKIERFEMKEIKDGFKNSQLVDTQIVSKYAYHYLKSVFNKVSVEKGSTTAEFRKIYKIELKNEKKDRATHIHHAKDAAVLTLIPSPRKRDEILNRSYNHFEKTRHQYHELPYRNFNLEDIKKIEHNILVNNIARDKALTSAKRYARKRGKLIYIKDKNGNKKKKVINGDSIRGELHEDTFLASIKRIKLDKYKTKLLDNNGKVLFEEKFVVRKPLIYRAGNIGGGFNKLSEIENCIVDNSLFKIIKSQVEGRNFQEALEDGVWMLNKKGEKVNRIRRIRCVVRVKEPLKIKEHVTKSRYPHKQFYYAVNATNYASGLYVTEKNERLIQTMTLFDISKLSKEMELKKIEGLFERTIIKNKKQYNLQYILKEGIKVLFYEKEKEELEEFTNEELSKRLYKIVGFEKDGRIKFKYHLEAREEKKIKTIEKESQFNFSTSEPKLRLTSTNWNFIVEGYDFIMHPDGKIEFIIK